MSVQRDKPTGRDMAMDKNGAEITSAPVDAGHSNLPPEDMTAHSGRVVGMEREEEFDVCVQMIVTLHTRDLWREHLATQILEIGEVIGVHIDGRTWIP